MTLTYINALGNLLFTYYTDLIYIRNFHRHKNGLLSASDYLEISNGSFQSFLNEYRIARNVGKLQVDKLLKFTIDWVTISDPKDVDGFARFLRDKGITHNKIMTSLASKILFLNDPVSILPMDKYTKKALHLKNNTFSDYLPLVHNFQKENTSEIKASLETIEKHLFLIEENFKTEILNLKKIRHNRFIDKILWTIGLRT